MVLARIYYRGRFFVAIFDGDLFQCCGNERSNDHLNLIDLFDSQLGKYGELSG